MSRIEMIHEKAEELAKLLKEEFPKATDFQISAQRDYIGITATYWDKVGTDRDYSKVLRREYLRDYKFGKDGWETGDIEKDNEYLASKGILKEGD